MDYLAKGGRLPKAVALAGSLLNIKPVLTFSEGRLTLLGKARGVRQSNKLINDTLRKVGGVDFSMPHILAYSGQDDSLVRDYMQESREFWAHKIESLRIATVGSSIGTHAGPGAVAMAFFAAGAEA